MFCREWTGFKLLDFGFLIRRSALHCIELNGCAALFCTVTVSAISVRVSLTGGVRPFVFW